MSPESEYESYIKPPEPRKTVPRITDSIRAIKPGDPPIDVSWHTLMSMRDFARRHKWVIVQQKNTKLKGAWKVWRVL